MYNKQNILRYFRQFSEQIPKIENLQNLIVVFGGPKAGKSVTVDLLSGKKLILSDDLQSGAPIIVQENNWECQYDSMNKSYSKNGLIIQSLTLNIDIKDSIQICKLIVLIHLLRQYQRVSFVLVIEEANILSLSHQLQEILGILGHNGDIKSQNLEIIKQYLYIIISKSTKTLVEIRQQIYQIPQSKHIRKILDDIMKREAIMLIPCQQPSFDSFGLTIKTKIIARESLYINKIIRNSVYYVSQIKINQQQQTQLMDFTEKLLLAVCNLIAYVAKKQQQKQKQKQYSIEYKRLMNQIFSSHLNKNSIEIMTDSINQYSKVSIADQRLFLLVMVESIAKILFDFKEKSPRVAKDYNCFLKLMKLFIISMPFIDTARLSMVQQKLRLFKLFVLQIHVQIDLNTQISTNLQSKNTFFCSFQQLMLKNCKNNLDAVRFCIQSQLKSQLNKQYAFPYYFIRLLRNLLSLFMQKYCSQSLNFSLELLQLCIIEQNYYYFNVQLDKALQNHYLKIENLDKLIQKLFFAQRYDECLKIIDYQMQYVTLSAKYQHLNKLKRLILKVKVYDYKCYKFKDSQDKKITNQQGLKISFTFESLNQRFSLMRQILGRNDFVEMIKENNIY